MNRKRIRTILNICIAVMVAGAWLGMIFLGGGDLTARGIGSLKYFTVLSNILCGVAALIWLVRGRNGDNEAIERLKYVAATAVALTFMTVVVFLGPLYGYPEMFEGANLWLHLIVPVAAIAEIIFLSDAEFTLKDNNIALLSPLIYGVFYLGNNIINGIGEWPDTNDWYLFLYWGYPIGIVIFVVIGVVTWLLAFFMRKANSKIGGSHQHGELDHE